MRKVGRRAFSAGLATLAACGGRTAVEPEERGAIVPEAGPVPGPSAPSATPFPDTPSAACSFPAFTSPGVTDISFAQRVLYSWTTKEQAQALRRDKVLYTKTANDQGEPGYLFRVLERLAQRKEPRMASAAELLGGNSFRLGRYAWPFPWATQITSATEDYGRELLRIELRANALLVFVDERWGSEPWQPPRVLDMSGKIADWARVQETPERIAGIYFVSRGGDAANATACPGGSLGPGLQYREFHLCHENTVASWSIGTEQILAQIQSDIAMLTRVGEAQDVLACSRWLCDDLARAWGGAPWSRTAGGAPEHLYTFLTHLHMAPQANRFRADLAQAQARLMAARFVPDPLVHVPAT